MIASLQCYALGLSLNVYEKEVSKGAKAVLLPTQNDEMIMQKNILLKCGMCRA